jgi:hypothetical protein
VSMSFICPKCKAQFLVSETCQKRFDRFQMKELEDPDYFLVHHLSVPCYMLQHNQYSRDGWFEVRKLLYKFVYENWTPDMARQHAQSKSKSGRLSYSLTRSIKLVEVEKITWSFIITNIRFENAADYCQDVRKWAKHIIEDTEPIVKELAETT